MAILLVKIENENSLAFNEFYDYSGCCYASTRSRENPNGKVIDMTSFYEATIKTSYLRDVPVVFASVENDDATIIGWYKKAEVFAKMQTLSFFLEGNIKAYAADAVWIPAGDQDRKLRWFGKEQLYEVIEEEDARFAPLTELIECYKGENQMLRYHTASVFTDAKLMKDAKSCKMACEQWASVVMEEKCRDIRDIKTLEAYAKKLCEKERKSPDGYYYLAFACYHLGFVKEGLKQINKALQLEASASDLIALKGMLLVSKGYAGDGALLLQEAYEKSHDEAYLLTEGRAFMLAGKVDNAYDCFKKIEDESLLEEMGIKLKDMEKQWNSIKVRYMKIKDIFKKK